MKQYLPPTDLQDRVFLVVDASGANWLGYRFDSTLITLFGTRNAMNTLSKNEASMQSPV